MHKKIPDVETLVGKIPTCTHGSTLRCTILHEVQDLLSTEKKKKNAETQQYLVGDATMVRAVAVPMEVVFAILS